MEGGDENEVKILSSLWNDKITKLDLTEFPTAEKIEGKTLVMRIHRGQIISILHKPSGLFLLIYGISALELESLRYIVEKSNNPNEDFVSLVYKYLNSGNGRLGYTNKM